jgi:hypothetical protein
MLREVKEIAPPAAPDVQHLLIGRDRQGPSYEVVFPFLCRFEVVAGLEDAGRVGKAAIENELEYFRPMLVVFGDQPALVLALGRSASGRRFLLE